MHVFGSSGVRGLAGSELTPPFVGRIAAAAGTTLGATTVGIARDTRTTGRLFADAAASALAGVGCDDHRHARPLGVRLGGRRRRDAESVDVITASHNPPAYNGVKLVGADGVELGRETLKRVEKRLLEESFELVGHDEIGRASCRERV